MVEGHVFPEREGIPIIAPPCFRLVHDDAFILRIDGNDLFLAVIGKTFVEMAMVVVRETSLFPTVRTQGRRRDRLSLPIKNWGNFVIEREIVVGDLER